MGDEEPVDHLGYVEREGAAQVMLFGPTNAGRSSLLRRLTNAQVTVADYNYTTQRPVPGMLSYEDIQLQLVELPAPQIDPENKFSIQSEAIDLIRACDGLMLVVDLSNEPVKQLNSLLVALEEVRISTSRSSSRVEIVSEKGSGEIRIAASGVQNSCTPAQIRELLHSYGIKNALVRIYGDGTIGDVEDAIFENVTIYKAAVIVANKIDMPNARQNAIDFEERIPISLSKIFTSCLTGEGLKLIGESTFRSLGIIRVYTKEPNELRPSKHPFVVKAGTTVRELVATSTLTWRTDTTTREYGDRQASLPVNVWVQTTS